MQRRSSSCPENSRRPDGKIGSDSISGRSHHARRQQGVSLMAQSEKEILDGLAEIVNEETGLDTASVELDKSFTDDLDIDSLSMMTIVVNAEEKFGVRIPDDEVKNLKTVRAAVSFIAGAQRSPPWPVGWRGPCPAPPPHSKPRATPHRHAMPPLPDAVQAGPRVPLGPLNTRSGTTNDPKS